MNMLERNSGIAELRRRGLTYSDVVPPASPVTEACVKCPAADPFFPTAFNDALFKQRPREEDGG